VQDTWCENGEDKFKKMIRRVVMIRMIEIYAFTVSTNLIFSVYIRCIVRTCVNISAHLSVLQLMRGTRMS